MLPPWLRRQTGMPGGCPLPSSDGASPLETGGVVAVPASRHTKQPGSSTLSSGTSLVPVVSRAHRRYLLRVHGPASIFASTSTGWTDRRSIIFRHHCDTRIQRVHTVAVLVMILCFLVQTTTAGFSFFYLAPGIWLVSMMVTAGAVSNAAFTSSDERSKGTSNIFKLLLY